MSEPQKGLGHRMVMWIAEHTPKCHDMTRLISQERDASLPWGTRVRMWLHYRICLWCRRYRDQIEFLGMALGECQEHPHGEGATLRDETKARWKKALREPR